MINLLKTFKSEFDKITKESYLVENTKKSIAYPYLTYTIDSEMISRNVEGFYIDVDVFDKGRSHLNIFVIDEALRSHFEGLDILTEHFLLRFNYMSGKTIGSGDDLIIRRHIQLNCKVEWRRK